MAKIKAVIFDLDNTLVDFMKMKDAAIDAAADAMIDAGLPIKKDEAVKRINEVYQEKGIEYQSVFDHFLMNVMAEVNPKILASGVIAYRRARESTLVSYPRVTITLLELLKRGLRLGVVSDAPRLQAWLRLGGLNIHNYFDVVVTFDDTNKRKPDAEPFRKTLELLKLRPNEVIMVGDWPERDIVGAKLLGMKTVFARYGDTFGTKVSGADWDIDDIYDLIKIIDNENK
jgi:putative hydrolase of the HAD superfamily